MDQAKDPVSEEWENMTQAPHSSPNWDNHDRGMRLCEPLMLPWLAPKERPLHGSPVLPGFRLRFAQVAYDLHDPLHAGFEIQGQRVTSLPLLVLQVLKASLRSA